MESLRTSLAPLTDWLPPDVRGWMPIEAWWGVLGGGALLALIVLWMLLRALGRGRVPAPAGLMPRRSSMSPRPRQPRQGRVG